MSIDAFLAHTARTAAELAAALPPHAALVHHNDADGLTSGSITATMLERLKIPFTRFCLERTYPEALAKILRGLHGLALIVDFGSGVLPILSKARERDANILVLDHHHVAPVEDSAVSVINCRSFGLDGNRECSAATTAYLFARAVAKTNTDLAWRALVGALGDRQLKDGRFTGLNAIAFDDARARGDFELRGERYVLAQSGHAMSAVVKALDSMGSAGYFSKGPEHGVRALCAGIGGLDAAFFTQAESYERVLSEAIAAALEKHPRKISARVQHITLGDECRGMGVKTAGLVAERLAESSKADPERYVAVFQRVPPEIPGLGIVLDKRVKVSFRVPPALAAEIQRSKAPSLTLLVPAATVALGGAVDGCHDLTAATVIAEGQEEALITAFEAAYERFAGAL
jgi:hypothetical protein